MGRLIVFLLIVPLLLFSCDEKETPETLFSEGRYKEAISLSNSILMEGLDESALYYKAASCYSLSLKGEAEEAAALYLLVYNEGEFRNQAKYIIFLTGSDADAIEAGEELMASGELSHRSMVRLCFLYAYNDMDIEFSRLYKKIRGELSEIENAFLLIAEGEDLSLIFMAFDKILESGSELDAELLETAADLFADKGKYDLFSSYIDSRGIAFTPVI